MEKVLLCIEFINSKLTIIIYNNPSIPLESVFPSTEGNKYVAIHGRLIKIPIKHEDILTPLGVDKCASLHILTIKRVCQEINRVITKLNKFLVYNPIIYTIKNFGQ